MALGLAIGLALFALFRARAILWDEAVYMGMAKYLLSGGDSGLWEVIRPPLLPALAGPLWKTGLGIADASRLVAAGFTVFSLFVTYLLARDLVDETVAGWHATLPAWRCRCSDSRSSAWRCTRARSARGPR